MIRWWVKRGAHLVSIQSPLPARQVLAQHSHQGPPQPGLAELERAKVKFMSFHSPTEPSEKIWSQVVHLTQDENSVMKLWWIDVAMTNPLLFKLSAQKLQAISDIFLRLGATPREACLILKRCPKSVILDATTFEHKCLEWQSFCDQLRLPWVDVLTEIPVVLGLSTDTWRDRIADLREHFSNSLSTLIVESPCVLVEDWGSLSEKIEFLLFTMQVSPASISKSGALGHDCEMLRSRYLFLDRSGIYKHPSAKSLELEDTAKPNINLIVIPSVPKFLAKCTQGCLSVEEYNTFLSLLAQEDMESRDAEEQLKTGLREYESEDEDESH
ncbi:hypothetical protein TCAL_00290 [Tigriopus californicus]|uniref:Uncharacterized protein n=2 Tax=Tigriopus californicus TaxID=6832 RepID=A0A553P3Y2_TIGCA|nr:hypothetical protein TCAL_00290 [Tigriopus californicus]|eukprot:TCALIF_00290-PA protein Name:"Similar to MTERFD2 mTERF domain-containing protein 2 (Homo sapiens)" AED:0.17 eAED:0.17 QI:0/-1/0/1/-1/1/1/0/326